MKAFCYFDLVKHYGDVLMDMKITMWKIIH